MKKKEKKNGSDEESFPEHCSRLVVASSLRRRLMMR